MNDTGTSDDHLVSFASNYKEYVHAPLVVSICFFGVLCNAANVVVLTKPKMRTSPTNVILTGLSAAQMCLLINYCSYTIYGMVDGDCSTSTKSYAWMTYLLLNVNLNVIFHTIALVLTTLIAVFRYIAVAFAARCSHWVTAARARSCVVSTYCAVPLACSTFYFNSFVAETTLGANCTNATGDFRAASPVEVYKLSFTRNTALFAYNLWMLAAICKLLPCICLVVLSVLLVRELDSVKRRRRVLLNRRQSSSTTLLAGVDAGQQHNRITVMLIVVVLLFVCVEMPQGIINLVAALYGYDAVRAVHSNVADFFDMLTVFYSSVNFVLYCTMSSQFRQCFAEIFLWSPALLKTRLYDTRFKRNKNSYLPVTTQTTVSPSSAMASSDL